jgi:hypothetical protein
MAMADEELTRNPVLRSVYLALLEILGQDKAEDLFKALDIDPQVLPNSDAHHQVINILDQVGNDLEKEYGNMAAQGLLIRSGRAALNFFRRYFPDVAELGSLSNRLKPVDKRFLTSLESLANLWSRETGWSASVEMTNRATFKWILQSDTGGNRYLMAPYFLFGLLEEFCTWLDARKSYQIVYSEPLNGEKAEISIAVMVQE